MTITQKDHVQYVVVNFNKINNNCIYVYNVLAFYMKNVIINWLKTMVIIVQFVRGKTHIKNS